MSYDTPPIPPTNKDGSHDHPPLEYENSGVVEGSLENRTQREALEIIKQAKLIVKGLQGDTSKLSNRIEVVEGQENLAELINAANPLLVGVPNHLLKIAVLEVVLTVQPQKEREALVKITQFLLEGTDNRAIVAVMKKILEMKPIEELETIIELTKPLIVEMTDYSRKIDLINLILQVRSEKSLESLEEIIEGVKVVYPLLAKLTESQEKIDLIKMILTIQPVKERAALVNGALKFFKSGYHEASNIISVLAKIPVESRGPVISYCWSYPDYFGDGISPLEQINRLCLGLLQLEDILRDPASNIEAENPETGLTPIQLAVLSGKKESVLSCLAKGASSTKRNSKGVYAEQIARINDQEEIVGLFLTQFEKNADIIRNLKNLAQVCGLSGTLRLEGTVIDLEGNSILQSGGSIIGSLPSGELKDIFMLALRMQVIEPFEIVKRIKNHEMVVIPCYMKAPGEEHCIYALIKDNLLVICNRGEGSEGKDALASYPIDPDRFTEDLISLMRYYEGSEIKDWVQFYYHQLPEALVPMEVDARALAQVTIGPVAGLLHEVSAKPQTVGNCSAASLKAALKAIVLMDIPDRDVALRAYKKLTYDLRLHAVKQAIKAADGNPIELKLKDLVFDVANRGYFPGGLEELQSYKEENDIELKDRYSISGLSRRYDGVEFPNSDEYSEYLGGIFPPRFQKIIRLEIKALSGEENKRFFMLLEKIPSGMRTAVACAFILNIVKHPVFRREEIWAQIEPQLVTNDQPITSPNLEKLIKEIVYQTFKRKILGD